LKMNTHSELVPFGSLNAALLLSDKIKGFHSRSDKSW